MKRTNVINLIVIAVVGAALSYLLEILLQTRGGLIFIPPITVAITLLAAGILAVLMAIPVRRTITGKSRESVNPFFAARVLALAKAVAYVGSIGLGIAVGIMVYLLSRETTPSATMLVNSISMVVAAVLSLAAGLIAEAMCKIPPGTDNKPGATNQDSKRDAHGESATPA